MDPELEDLLQAAVAWSEHRGRVLDAELLVQALDLRLELDEWGDAWWPAGSVRHLMEVRYPVHGPVEAPDPAALVATLDSYWRFLRASGRMASASASPAELLAEAKRARSAMARACAEPRNVERRTVFARHHERLRAPAAPPDVAGALAGFRASGLYALVDSLRHWCEGEGQVGDDGELDAEQARELWQELGLGEWTARFEQLAAGRLEQADEAHQEAVAWDPEWLGSGDALALDRLWWSVVDAELLEDDPEPETDPEAEPEGELDEAASLLVSLVRWCAWREQADPLLMLLQLLGTPGEEPRTVAEAMEFWVSQVGVAAEEAGSELEEGAGLAAANTFLGCLATFDDAGLWRREADLLHSTALGHWFTGVLVALVPLGLLDVS